MNVQSLHAQMYVKTIYDLPLDDLWQLGIRGILFDLDNTVTKWNCQQVSEETRLWFADLKRRGFKACLLSNGRENRVRIVAEKLGVACVANAAKPKRRGFLCGCSVLGLPPAQVAMVGDQLFTDIYGANRAGLFTVLSEVIDPHEFWFTRFISRKGERMVQLLSKSNNKRNNKT